MAAYGAAVRVTAAATATAAASICRNKLLQRNQSTLAAAEAAAVSAQAAKAATVAVAFPVLVLLLQRRRRRQRRQGLLLLLLLSTGVGIVDGRVSSVPAGAWPGRRRAVGNKAAPAESMSAGQQHGAAQDIQADGALVVLRLYSCRHCRGTAWLCCAWGSPSISSSSSHQLSPSGQGSQAAGCEEHLPRQQVHGVQRGSSRRCCSSAHRTHMAVALLDCLDDCEVVERNKLYELPDVAAQAGQTAACCRRWVGTVVAGRYCVERRLRARGGRQVSRGRCGFECWRSKECRGRRSRRRGTVL